MPRGRTGVPYRRRMWSILLVPACVVLGIGACIYALARRAGGQRVLSAIAALVLSPLVTYAGGSAAIECDSSLYLKRELRKRLSPAEFAARKPDRWLCPTGYTFARNGKPESAFAVFGLFRTKIFHGDENSP
ncbi:hypothetical protein SAMN05444746_103165 [Variovorax sp. OK212]|nr:hypothetical protein SAMN05518853_103165 [Variovorax sp. OK202]SFC80709.1 hypothetical protein SAMN05444746_103165 [Variovorax sp. OK212]